MGNIAGNQEQLEFNSFHSSFIFKRVVIALFLLSSIFADSLNNSNDDTDDLYKLTIEELMNIEIVTAGKITQKLSDVPASAIIISRQEIQRQGYHTLEEIIQNIPGFYGINDYGEGGMMFGIRGFWSGVPNDKIIILINNVPQTKNVFSSHPISEIPVPVEAIERIEVVRGPMSIIYGSGAFYGAINIITETAEKGESHHIVALSKGSAATNKAFLRISHKSEDIDISTNVSVHQTAGIDASASDLMSAPAQLLQYGIPANYTTAGSMSRDHKYFDFSARLKAFKIHLVLVEISEGGHFSFPSYGDGHQENYSDFNLAVGYHKQIRETLSINSRVAYFKDRVWFTYRFFHDNFYGIQQLESNAIEITSDVFYKPSSSLNIQSGVFIKSIYDIYNMFDIPSFGDPYFENNFIKLDENSSIDSRSFYTQVEYTGIPKIHLLAGFRIEKSFSYSIAGGYSYDTPLFETIERDVDRENIEILPKFSLIYKLNDRNIMKLLYGKANKQPSFFQDHIQTQVNDNALFPENIETFELNYQTAFKSDYLISFNLFYNTLDNLITRTIELDDFGNYESSVNKNAGRLITNGLELSFNYRPSPKFSAEISTTHQTTVDKLAGHEDIQLAYSPNHLGYLKIEYDITKHISIAMNAQFVDRMETYWDDSPDETSVSYLPLGRIGKAVDGYTLMGANFRINELIIPGVYAHFRIANLLDSEIRYPTFTNNPWADKGTIGQSRAFYITLGRHF